MDHTSSQKQKDVSLAEILLKVSCVLGVEDVSVDKSMLLGVSHLELLLGVMLSCTF